MQVQVDIVIDHTLGAPQGNWKVLSFGELALMSIVYVVIDCSHYLRPIEEWISQHLTSLRQALGKPMTSVSVYHQPQDNQGLLRFSHS